MADREQHTAGYIALGILFGSAALGGIASLIYTIATPKQAKVEPVEIVRPHKRVHRERQWRREMRRRIAARA